MPELDIPNLAGVPPLPSYSANAISLLAADVAVVVAGLLGPAQWGIYLDGVPAIDANSTIDFDYRQDWTISDYPVEEGGFQNYDKVQHPFDVRVRVATGGSVTDRQALLDSVQAAANSMNLYDVYTPEAVFSSCNVTHIDFNRKAMNGLGLFMIDIWLEEVRVTSTATFTNTQSPTDAGTQGIGNVQPQAPDQVVQQSLSGGWQ